MGSVKPKNIRLEKENMSTDGIKSFSNVVVAQRCLDLDGSFSLSELCLSLQSRLNLYLALR